MRSQRINKKQKKFLERLLHNNQSLSKKSCIRETKNLSTDADNRTDTILERLRDLSKKNKKNKGCVDFL